MQRLRLVAVCIIILAALTFRAPAAAPATVFAAASLADAMEEIGQRYRETSGGEVRFSFASSSTLARQIEAGAPASIFASANERWMDHLAAAGLIDGSTRISPIGNSLVLVSPAGGGMAEVALDAGIDLASLLGAEQRLAVGDPEHVPAGIYARQALQALGQWDALAPRLARADNVRAALVLVERGEVPFGIVYGTDAAISPDVEVVGVFPADSHRPITYPFAIVTDAVSEEVQELFAFITGPAGLEVFQSYGFLPN